MRQRLRLLRRRLVVHRGRRDNLRRRHGRHSLEGLVSRRRVLAAGSGANQRRGIIRQLQQRWTGIWVSGDPPASRPDRSPSDGEGRHGDGRSTDRSTQHACSHSRACIHVHRCVNVYKVYLRPVTRIGGPDRHGGREHPAHQADGHRLVVHGARGHDLCRGHGRHALEHLLFRRMVLLANNTIGWCNDATRLAARSDMLGLLISFFLSTRRFS